MDFFPSQIADSQGRVVTVAIIATAKSLANKEKIKNDANVNERVLLAILAICLFAWSNKPGTLLDVIWSSLPTAHFVVAHSIASAMATSTVTERH